MRTWRRLNHRNLVPFLGYIVDTEGMTLGAGFVSPWCQNGNVKSYLRSNPNADRVALVGRLLNWAR